MTKTKRKALTHSQAESWRISDARSRRATGLAVAVVEWMRLAEQLRYPRSLVEILWTALSHEYRLGMMRRPDREGM